MGKNKGQDSNGHGAPKGQISDRLKKALGNDDEAWSPPRSGEPVKDPKTSKRHTKPGEETGWSFTGRKK